MAEKKIKTKRLNFYIDDADAKLFARVKKEQFYDQSYADMYRAMLRVGAAQLAKKK